MEKIFIDLMIIGVEFDCIFSQRFPFDYKHPYGFLLVNFIQFFVLWYSLIAVSSLLSFGIGVFLLSIARVDDLKINLLKIKQTDLNQLTMFDLVNKFINYHTIVQELSN